MRNVAALRDKGRGGGRRRGGEKEGASDRDAKWNERVDDADRGNRLKAPEDTRHG